MQINDDLPVYTIGVAAKILNVHPRTLRIYEQEGLIKPHRHMGNRMFSPNDLKWIECIRSLIHEQNINVEGLKRLIEVLPCWKIKGCSEDTIEKCSICQKKQKRCWEFAQRACEKSCKNCQTYLSESK